MGWSARRFSSPAWGLLRPRPQYAAVDRPLVTDLYFDRGSIAFTRLELLLVGILWSVLTVGFEFVVGFAEGTPIGVPVAQYDVFAGQVWAFVPFTLLVSPLIFGTLSSEY